MASLCYRITKSEKAAIIAKRAKQLNSPDAVSLIPLLELKELNLHDHVQIAREEVRRCLRLPIYVFRSYYNPDIGGTDTKRLDAYDLLLTENMSDEDCKKQLERALIA